MHPLAIANHTFNWGSRTYVMGILNVTPDSFSGDGLLAMIESNDPLEPMREQARGFLESKCDLLDVGGESTRPGSAPVDAETEKKRVLPVIEMLAR